MNENFLADNLSDLEYLYLERTSALRAVKIFEQMTPSRLSHLLRDPELESVDSQREVEERDAFDELMSYYSILEVACLANYVPPDPDVPKRHLTVLSSPTVRRFYESRFTLLLPTLFRCRLQGNPLQANPLQIDTQADEDYPYALFEEFTSQYDRLWSNKDVEVFLWFLDGGSWEYEDISDMMAILESTKEFSKAIATSPEERSYAQDSVLGLQAFFAFCLEFDSMLHRCGRWPILQSAMWHFYSYWFERIGNKLQRLAFQSLERIQDWSLPDDVDVEDRPTALSDRDEMVVSLKSTISRLVSGRFGDALREVATTLVSRKTGIQSTERISKPKKRSHLIRVKAARKKTKHPTAKKTPTRKRSTRKAGKKAAKKSAKFVARKKAAPKKMAKKAAYKKKVAKKSAKKKK